MSGNIDYDMPAEVYHARSELSSSTVAGLTTMVPARWRAQTMRRAKAEAEKAKKAATVPTSALEFGTIAHSVVLEPDTLEQRYMVGHRPEQRSNAGKQAWADLHAMARTLGKVLVSQQDMDDAKQMRDQVLRLPAVASILQGGGKPEVSVFSRDDETGVDLRSREDLMPSQDGFSSDVIVDLKTARDVTPRWFGTDAVRMGYDVRAYHYRRCRQLATGQDQLSFVWIVVESEWPFLACDVWVEPGMWPMFEARWRAAVKTWVDCVTTGNWPLRGPDDSYIQLPDWYYRQHGGILTEGYDHE